MKRTQQTKDDPRPFFFVFIESLRVAALHNIPFMSSDEPFALTWPMVRLGKNGNLYIGIKTDSQRR